MLTNASNFIGQRRSLPPHAPRVEIPRHFDPDHCNVLPQHQFAQGIPAAVHVQVAAEVLSILQSDWVSNLFSFCFLL